jgi:hypothetical protein
MEILFVVRPKEVLMAVREKGFPLLAYQSLLAVWGGLMHTSTSSNTSWEHEAMRGSWAIQSIDRLVQEVLGRFARTEEIRELAPRMARGWKAEGVFAGSNDTGRETPEFNVLHGELRDSHEFREALTFGENSEATSALRRAELLGFVQHNLDCANSTGVMGDCSMLQALDMPDLARLWNSIGPLLGGASSRSVEDRNSRPEDSAFQQDSEEFPVLVAIYANNRPRYLQQVLQGLKRARGVEKILLVVSLNSSYAAPMAVLETDDFCRMRVLLRPMRSPPIGRFSGGRGQDPILVVKQQWFVLHVVGTA